MSWSGPDFHPDPKKITVRRGMFFNPWVNISACVILTIGLAATTGWLVSQYREVSTAPPYPDQGLDTTGLIIGIVGLGFATLGLVGCTIFTILWWARRIRRERGQRHGMR